MWAALADLPLTVEASEYDVLVPGPEFGEQAHTTQLVRLTGAGHEGLGEDITYFFEPCPPVEFTGEYTLASFCAHLRTVEKWTQPPEWEKAPRFRDWAFQSAALDLALQQAGRPLHAVLGREPRPMRFVNSLGLGEEPDAGRVLRRLERHPGLRFKLDAHPSWSDAICERLAATGAVDIIDFKGHYGFEVEDEAALLRMYDRVLAAFPNALLEDAHDLPDVAERLQPHRDRISYDAPIGTVADLDATPLPARTVNVKPSRIGDLETLFAVYAACAERDLPMYGGGMGENGVARGQIQLLASLYSPDGPNDCAPSGYNALEPAAALPASPLPPAPSAAGFRRALEQ